MADTPESRPALLSSLPLWVQAVSMVGFPILVSSFYMAKEVGYLPSVAEVNAGTLRTVLAQHETLATQSTELVRLVKEICHNTARTEGQVRACSGLAGLGGVP